jgi:hypothetical protein
VISRLCGRQWKLNSDEEGQFKFFGPTSSLHLTESVSLSLLESWSEKYDARNTYFHDEFDLETQSHLLDIYWTYQHGVLQVFDKELFLHGMRTRKSRYFSKALLYCIYACAARISDRPALRNLVLPATDDFEEQQPYLIATATNLIDLELKRPQITTIQALLLLSVVYCALSKDTKGWLFTGISKLALGL